MYALKLDTDGRILHAVTEEFKTAEHVLVEQIPDDDLYDYRYVNGEFVYDPLEKPVPEVTRLDIIEAQVTYTAMMTDTILEV